MKGDPHTRLRRAHGETMNGHGILESVMGAFTSIPYRACCEISHATVVFHSFESPENYTNIRTP